MTQNAPPRLFSDEEIRAGYRREQQVRRDIREYLDKRIAPQVDKLRATFERERMKLRAAFAAEGFETADPCMRATFDTAGKELERLIMLCGTDAASESQQRIVVVAREHPERILSMLEAVYESPAINKFWRHHAKTHHGDAKAQLGVAGHGLLGQLVREYFENIPDISDLRGKFDRGRG